MAAPSISAQIIGAYSPAELVQQFGSTKAIAAAVGVTQRTVQRWLTVKGSEKAKPSKAAQAKIRKAIGPKKGIRIKGNVKVNGYERDRTIDFPGHHKSLSESQWDRLNELAVTGDDAAVWQQVATDYHVGSIELVSGTIDVI